MPDERHNGDMESGSLRLYLGAASGVGTTYAMLDEGKRRQSRGTHVAIGWVNAHQRPFTQQLLNSLCAEETVPSWLKVESIINDRPEVVLIDDLGRPNGSPGATTFHWEDVEKILDAGIDVVATLTIQHIASLAPQITEIIGAVPNGSIPERFLARAHQIELIDVTPEAIRRRIAHGNVFMPTELRPLDADLFNSIAFAQLRSLTFQWMSERLQGELPVPVASDKIAVLLDGTHDSALLARATRLAQQSNAEVLGLFIAPPNSSQDEEQRQRRRSMVEDSGGSYHEIVEDDAPSAFLAFAHTERATTLIADYAIPRQHGIRLRIADFMLPETDISLQRKLLGVLAGALVLSALTVGLVANRDVISVPTSLALYLLAVVGVTAIGGRWPGIISALFAPLLANWYLIPPYHTFRINDGENILELVVFVSATTIVSAFVSLASRRSNEAERAWREASTLAALNESSAADPLDGIIELLSKTFDLSGVSVLKSDNDHIETVASIGSSAPTSAQAADFTSEIAPGVSLAINGPALTANDHRLLTAFVGQLSNALEQRELRHIAMEANALAKADELRTAILRAVSHDLRSPLASIKASVSSLRQPDIDWPEDVREDFLAAIESDTDRLTGIITNLLDLSRIEAGVLRPVLRKISLEEILPTAVQGLNSQRITIDVPHDLSDMDSDPALLERVLANLMGNALTWSPADKPIIVRAHERDNFIQIHIIDYGIGIPQNQRATVLQPFHRLSDSTASGGLGLGLAIADRLIASMNGRLELRDTPGGGLTAVVIVPIARQSS
jgi:two-component system, OmpR family, sensor histidine kinase KdpD